MVMTELFLDIHKYLRTHQKYFSGIYLIHKRYNVKFKIYLELSLFCATQPTLTEHGRHRPYIHIRSTPAGQ